MFGADNKRAVVVTVVVSEDDGGRGGHLWTEESAYVTDPEILWCGW